MWTYSLIWMKRKVLPSRNVERIPALSPKRLPCLIEVRAQCIVSEEESRMAVLTPATATGSSVPVAGQGVHRGGVGVGVADHAGDEQALAAHRPEHPVEPLAGLPGVVPEAAFLGHDDDEEMLPLLGRLRPHLLEQLVASHGAIGDDERDGEGRALLREVDDDVLDRQPGGLADALDQVLAQPARLRDRMGGDDDLVGAVVGDRVHRRLKGVLVAHVPDQLDALGGEELLGQVDAHLRGVAHRLVVDDRAVRRAVLRNDQRELRVAPGVARAHRVDQLGAADGLVGDYEDLCHGLTASHSRLGAVATAPAAFASTRVLNTPWTAPRTPDSYGP